MERKTRSVFDRDVTNRIANGHGRFNRRGTSSASTRETCTDRFEERNGRTDTSQTSVFSVFESQSTLLNALPLSKRWTPGIASIARESLSGRTHESLAPSNTADALTLLKPRGQETRSLSQVVSELPPPPPTARSVFSELDKLSECSGLWDAPPSAETHLTIINESDNENNAQERGSSGMPSLATPVRHRKAHIKNPDGRFLNMKTRTARDETEFSEVDDEPLSTQAWRRRRKSIEMESSHVSTSSSSTREVALRSPPNREFSKDWLRNATASDGLNESDDASDSRWPVRGGLFDNTNETFGDHPDVGEQEAHDRKCVPFKEWTLAQRQDLTRLVLSRPLSNGLPIAKIIGVVREAMVRLDRLHGGHAYKTLWRSGTPSCGAVDVVDRLLADQQTSPDADGFPNAQTLRLPAGAQGSGKETLGGTAEGKPQFAEIDERDEKRFDLFDEIESDTGYVAMYSDDEPLRSNAPVMASNPLSPDELASHATRTCKDVILTRPTFSADSKTVNAFVTFGADVFYGSGRSAAMVPRAWEYTGVTHSATETDMHAARVPFRWFIVPLSVVARLPRATPFTFNFPTDSGEDYGLLVYLETHNRNALFPLDTLFALGIASAHVVQLGPPTTASLKLDLNPDRALDYMPTIEPTLVNRYRAQHREEKNMYILDEGVSWVIGVEYTHGDFDDVAPLRTTVLQEFTLPRGSGTAQWSTTQLYDMLNPSNLYRQP